MSKAIHIICGKCGSNEYMKYRVDRYDGCYDVVLICDNCGELTGLDQIIKEEKK